MTIIGKQLTEVDGSLPLNENDYFYFVSKGANKSQKGTVGGLISLIDRQITDRIREETVNTITDAIDEIRTDTSTTISARILELYNTLTTELTQSFNSMVEGLIEEESDYLKGLLQAEVDDRTQATTRLQEALSIETADRLAAIQELVALVIQESATRLELEGSLREIISQEISQRGIEDGLLDERISAEVATRLQEIASLRQSINQESSERHSDVLELYAAISQEVATRSAAVSSEKATREAQLIVVADRMSVLEASTAAAINHEKITSGNPHGVNKAHVGLGLVDNTADIDKPVSELQRAAITDAVAPLATKVAMEAGDVVVKDLVEQHKALTNNPHGVTKEQIGLNHVDNTSDLEKPISNAAQLALNDKLGRDEAYLKEEVYNKQEADNKHKPTRETSTDPDYVNSTQDTKGLLKTGSDEIIRIGLGGGLIDEDVKLSPHFSTDIQFKIVSADGFINNLVPFKKQFDAVYTLPLQNINSIMDGIPVGPNPFAPYELFGQTITQFKYTGNKENYTCLKGTFDVLVKVQDGTTDEFIRVSGGLPTPPPALWFEIRTISTRPTADRSARRGLAMDLAADSKSKRAFTGVDTGFAGTPETRAAELLAQSPTDWKTRSDVVTVLEFTDNDVGRRILAGSTSEELDFGTNWKTSKWIPTRGCSTLYVAALNGTSSVSRIQYKDADGKIYYGQGQGSNDVGIETASETSLGNIYKPPATAEYFRVGFGSTPDTAEGIRVVYPKGRLDPLGGRWVKYTLNVNSTVVFSPDSVYEFTLQFYGSNFSLNPYGFFIHSGGLDCRVNVTDEIIEAAKGGI